MNNWPEIGVLLLCVAAAMLCGWKAQQNLSEKGKDRDSRGLGTGMWRAADNFTPLGRRYRGYAIGLIIAFWLFSFWTAFGRRSPAPNWPCRFGDPACSVRAP
jgi:hypothetical protein